MPQTDDYRELSTSTQDPVPIEALWSFEASSTGEHLVLPDGRMDLIVRFRADAGERVSGTTVLVAGPAQRAARVAVGVGERFFGIRFRPGWGGACLGVDPASLRDMTLRGEAAERLVGADAQRLRAATTVGALREALIDCVRRRSLQTAAVPREIRSAIDLLHESGGRLGQSELAAASGLAPRSLRRHLAEAVGLSYKTFASVLRFQRTMRLLAQQPAPSLGQAALEGGYSDQAHMTREFRRHGGFTPGTRPPAVLIGMPIGGLAETFKRGRTGAG
ncbi:AraC family transcriptional regulator [Tahibacter caeni]|uniref:AraC family transcriptional regulator n=1 Tax=Tahibacter caeni TaxID=1453545 RepID=UPI00214920E3|nr:helix-turn-helix domain-containing protein [Tahibacter caeni]